MGLCVSSLRNTKVSLNLCAIACVRSVSTDLNNYLVLASLGGLPVLFQVSTVHDRVLSVEVENPGRLIQGGDNTFTQVIVHCFGLKTGCNYRRSNPS